MTEAAEPQKAPVVAEAHLVDTFRKPEQNPNFLAPFLVCFWFLAPNRTELCIRVLILSTAFTRFSGRAQRKPDCSRFDQMALFACLLGEPPWLILNPNRSPPKDA